MMALPFVCNRYGAGTVTHEALPYHLTYIFIMLATNVITVIAKPAMPAKTSIPCSEEALELVKAQKRGGESYDRLLRKMVSQYDPAAEDNNV